MIIMNKFCGECGTKTVNGKCPNCDTKKEVKEVKKVEETNNAGANIGWGILGFFFPIVGLILFILWINNKKKASRAAGIGALIGFVLSMFLSIIMFVLLFIWTEDTSYYPPTIYDDYYYDYDDDYSDEDDIASYTEDDYDVNILVKDIDTSKNFEKFNFGAESLEPFEEGKEYGGDPGYSYILKNKELSLLDSDTGELISSIKNIDKAYYHSIDCSGMDSIIAYSGNDIYYGNPKWNISQTGIAFKKLTNNYKSIVLVHNMSWTCGGGTVTLGVTESAKGDEIYYDLNNETIFAKDTYHYYENNKRYILTNRSYSYDKLSGSAKLLIKSTVSDAVLGVIDSNNVAYDFWDVYHPTIGSVERVTVKDNVTTLHLSNGTKKVFEYSEVEY